MVRESLDGRYWAYGGVLNVDTPLQAEPMTSSKSHNATIEIRTKNSKIVFSALKPDMIYSNERNTKASITIADNTVIINIASDQISDLRASLNSYLRLFRTAVSCLDLPL